MTVDKLSLAGARILIVEDHYVVAEALRFLLNSYGGSVTTVPDLERAFRVFAEDPVDIAILDIDLNGKSVVPFAEHLASKGVPFVFLTGYGDEQLLPESLRETSRFDKPVRDDQLVHRMMELLGTVPEADARDRARRPRS
jgi:DNA-binding response OmpR family regulator